MARDPSLDLVFYDCTGYDRFGNPNQGVAELNPTGGGEWISLGFITTAGELSPSGDGEFIYGWVVNAVAGELNPDGGDPDIVFAPPYKSWVKWSEIGEINFDIGLGNVAGERPIDWQGNIYKIIPLRIEVYGRLVNQMIVYGSGGVSRLLPVQNTFGVFAINKIGIPYKGAAINVEHSHYFIDNNGCLWNVADKVTQLHYEEFLSQLTNLVMLYDEVKRIIYICDGTLGYIYSIDDNSLGEGPSNVTGIGYSEGTQYLLTSGTLSVPKVDLITEVFDLGSRKNKTVESVEIEHSAEQFLLVAVESKAPQNATFNSSPYVTSGPNGIAYPRGFGQDFKIKIKASSLEDFRMARIKINGQFHQYNPTD
jgi:hypothetical protein